MPKLDPLKLTPEQRDQLENYQLKKDQLETLNDIASMTQEVINLLDDKTPIKKIEQLGAVLTDARNQLVKLNAKEAPEAPDTSKPVVDAISSLERALRAAVTAQKTPIVNVPKQDAPTVNVEAPTVDTSKVESILKKELPKALADAVAAIKLPKTDNSSLSRAISDLGDKLDSIDTGVRLKPQAPEVLKVINEDGTAVNQSPSLAVRIDATTTANTTYIGKATIGTTTSSAAWQVAKLDTTSGLVKTWADGNASFDNIWDNRTSLTYN